MRTSALRSVILVHGAWAGGWVWDKVVPLLAEHGVRAVIVDLPTMPDATIAAEDISLDRYVDIIGQEIDQLTGDVYLVGHSGGGIVATAAAERHADRIAGVIYVAGILLPSGLDLAEFGREEAMDAAASDGVAPYLESLDEVATWVPTEVAVAVFFHHASAADAITAARRLTPHLHDGVALAAAWTPERFGSLPRLYVEASADRCLPLPLQRRMQARTPGAATVTLDADHVPQLSAPESLADVIAAFVRERSPSRSPF